MSELHSWARALGGDVTGGGILCPGPGHTAADRSLSVKIGRDGEPICYSHSGNDPILCKDFVREKIGLTATQGKAPKTASIVTGAGTFMRSYEAISYTIDGVLPSGCLYGLTAKPGTGKTAWMIAATLAVETGRENILGCPVERDRVAYVTIENPVDFKMKLAVNCYFHNISFDEIEHRVAIIDGRDTPEQIYEGLRLDAEAHGNFQLVNFDTFQAGFAVANAGAFNDNEAVLKYVQRLRPLTVLPGLPSVLVAFHPTKNALEAELIPYGGGATYGEIDGNLTLWKEPRSSSIGTAFADPSSSHGFSGSKN
jgi:hypothetical protein